MTSQPTVNLLVIGRSPRPALEAEFRRVLGDGCDLRTIGALDHLDISSIEANPPRSDADTLFSILPDGQSTLLSKAHVTEELRTRLRARQPDDNEIDVLCCTGRFDEFAGDRVIKASEVLLNTVRGVGSVAQSIGVFIPKPQQVANAADRWKAGGFAPNVVALAPDASDDEIDVAAASRVGTMDCSIAPLTEPDMRTTHPALWIGPSKCQLKLGRYLRGVKFLPSGFQRDQSSCEPGNRIGPRHARTVGLVPDTPAAVRGAGGSPAARPHCQEMSEKEAGSLLLTHDDRSQPTADMSVEYTQSLDTLFRAKPEVSHPPVEVAAETRHTR